MTARYPALLHSEFHEPLFHHFVGVDDNAFGIGDVAAQKDACLTLSDAVLDPIAGVDYQSALIFEFLKQFCRPLFATHVDDYRFGHLSGAKLLLAVDVDLAAAFSQVLGHCVHYSGVVAYVVGGVSPCAHNRGNPCGSHL